MYVTQSMLWYNSKPNIWSVLSPTMFPGSTLLSGPKHSTSVPFSVVSAVPLSVDLNEVASFIPNPVPDLAVKALSGPQIEEEVDLCGRGHSLPPPTLQMVNPLMSPTTVHWKVKTSPGQVGGAAANCPASPGEKWSYLIHVSVHTSACCSSFDKMKFRIQH